MNLFVRKSNSIEEKKQITSLLAGSFPGKPEDLAAMFSLILDAHPDLTTVLVENDEAELVSALFLVTGNFEYNSTNFTYCNMSYFATESAYRKGEATALIIKYVTDVIQNEFDLVFGFPRHVMRGYWSRYQFQELTNSNCAGLRLKKSDLPSYQGTIFRVASAKDVSALNRIYSLASANRLIDFKRSLCKWEYLLDISRLHKLKILVCEESSGEELGYVVIRDDLILEIACIDGRESQILTQDLLASQGLIDITISLRGVLPGFSSFLHALIQAYEEPEMIKEGLWDFMYFCGHKELNEYLRKSEGSNVIESNSIFVRSNFTVLDQY